MIIAIKTSRRRLHRLGSHSVNILAAHVGCLPQFAMVIFVKIGTAPTIVMKLQSTLFSFHLMDFFFLIYFLWKLYVVPFKLFVWSNRHEQAWVQQSEVFKIFASKFFESFYLLRAKKKKKTIPTCLVLMVKNIYRVCNSYWAQSIAMAAYPAVSVQCACVWERME